MKDLSRWARTRSKSDNKPVSQLGGGAGQLLESQEGIKGIREI